MENMGERSPRKKALTGQRAPKGQANVEILCSWVSLSDRGVGDLPGAQWENARRTHEEFSGAIKAHVTLILFSRRPVSLRYGIGNTLLQSLVLSSAADLRGVTRIRSNRRN